MRRFQRTIKIKFYKLLTYGTPKEHTPYYRTIPTRLILHINRLR